VRSVAAQDEIRSRATQLRLEAIEAQLAAAFNFCSTAKNALALHQIQCCLDAIKSATHTARTVRIHLDEPNHVPAHSMVGVRDQLAKLETEIIHIEERASSRKG
jgi:hypothetical protein